MISYRLISLPEGVPCSFPGFVQCLVWIRLMCADDWPLQSRIFVMDSLGTVCSSSTPGSSLCMANFHKSHLPLEPSLTHLWACGSIGIFLPFCLARAAVSPAQVGGKWATSLGAHTDACCDSFDRESSCAWLHFPILLGLTLLPAWLVRSQMD